eukprot:CAMPEP_0198199912 /NCGR_PEP_ID=MMETSP1445-20131203/3020_1 /TAXON_ID=36898 /ORGANISM="Pyramimonas sp., Strain CCMP2087" /LENGTH=731 /DNA_ID=CAMNT_0043869823 /DNA_START=481 /DNA_END=2676 /DNA_ORIENTATION=-
MKTLGRGAQGTVILVRRKADRAKFCIKKIYIEDQSPDDQEAVMNEIKVLAKLAHPNIVAYYGSFMESDDLNVVMEYADGGTLWQHIQKAKAPFREEEIMRMFTQLLLCLDYVHKKKILHRDLKTKNIFITKKLQLKLGDFGLSKMMGSQTDFAQSAVGTPYYLSPELCEGKPYNHKSDVWAAGCVLYELTTFKHAFDATNLPALVMSIVQGKVDPLPKSYSSDMQELIQLMLNKEPDMRPDIPGLLQHPLVTKYVRLLEVDSDKASFDRERMNMMEERTFIESGNVETVLHQARAGQATSTDAIMNEVQEEQEACRLIAQMRKTISIQDRVLKRVPYFKTFVAKDLVNFMIDRLGIRDRTEATLAGQQWMDAGVFYHVTRTERFVDGEGLYRFKEDEVGSILNMKSTWQGGARHPTEVESDIRGKLSTIYDAHLVGRSRKVDYEGLALSDYFIDYQAASTELQIFDISVIAFNMKIAFYINLYNALVLHGFMVIGPPSSLYQRIYFYNHTCYNLGGMTYSLNDIEHGLLRGNQKPINSYCRVFAPNDPRLRSAVVIWDPRIHFALVRGTKSCPILRVYDPERLDEMLNEATSDFCSLWIEVTSVAPAAPDENPLASWSIKDLKELLVNRKIDTREFTEKSELVDACRHEMQRDASSGNGEPAEVQVNMPAIFAWYYDDFGGSDEGLLLWVKHYLQPFQAEAIDKAIVADNYIIKYKPFDWALNKKMRDQMD